MLRLTVLGSGDAFNSVGALHSCYLLEHSGGTLMLECGPSVLAGMKRAGIPTDAPDAILVSHLHGDHFGGIPFLFLEYLFKRPRHRPLSIVGPPTTAERVRALHAALYKGSHCRRLAFELSYLAVKPGERFELAGFAVEAFEVPHKADPFALAYRLGSDGGTVLFSGDSAWTQEFALRSRGVDLFLCECCSMEPNSNMHTSYREILEHRGSLACARLLLTHLGADVRSASGLTAECAHDGMVVEIGRREA